MLFFFLEWLLNLDITYTDNKRSENSVT
jgi:hypothetical protein